MKPLGFLIITYNRPNDVVELLQNIMQLTDATTLLEEVIIINNCSTEDYTNVENLINIHPNFSFKYYNAPSNLGVAKGRNFGLTKGNTPIVIMIDDDAVLQNKDCLFNLVKIFKQKKTEREIAIVSFKVLYYDTLQMQQTAFPHKKFEQYKDKDFFETYYYAGGAHAIKRNVFEKVGYYPTDFFYGMEEYDLSYRLLDAGYCITYSNAITMLHKESPLGRKPKEEQLRMMWVNKTKVAWKYLPQKYFYSTAFMWGLQYLRKCGFNINGFLKGIKTIQRIKKENKRNTISTNTLTHLKKIKARLWY